MTKREMRELASRICQLDKERNGTEIAKIFDGIMAYPDGLSEILELDALICEMKQKEKNKYD